MTESMKNTPYKKVHVDGVLINPITKDKPYLHQHPTTAKTKKVFNQLRKLNKNKR